MKVAGAQCPRCYAVINNETESKEHPALSERFKKRFGKRVCNECLNKEANKVKA